MNAQIKSLLENCGSRREILTDARSVNPDLEMVAVHRWHQRGSVPAKYWKAISDGAQSRGNDITLQGLAEAHAMAGSAA